MWWSYLSLRRTVFEELDYELQIAMPIAGDARLDK